MFARTGKMCILKVLKHTPPVFCLFALFLCFSGKMPAEIVIETAFNNGHIGQYQILEPDTVKIGPLSYHKEIWFNFRIKGVKDKKINFIRERTIGKETRDVRSFFGGDDTCVYISYDGKSYQVAEITCEPGDKSTFKASSFTGSYLQKWSYTFKEDSAIVSYSPVYTNERLELLAKELSTNPYVKIESLGNSPYKKRPVYCFKITDYRVDDREKKGVVILGRGDDCWEVSSSTYGPEGMLRYLTSEAPALDELRKKTVFYIFPIITPDGVDLGWSHYPLDVKCSDFLSFGWAWQLDPPLPEVKIIKEYFVNLKNAGLKIDLAFRVHGVGASVTGAGGRIGCELKSKNSRAANEALEELDRCIVGFQPWVQPHMAEDHPEYDTKTASVFLRELFPQVLTNHFHLACGFALNSKRRIEAFKINTEESVFFRQEDHLQHGEMTVRSLAKYYGLKQGDAAPFLLGANIDKNYGKKGVEVTFRVYYFDINGRPPEVVNVFIGGKKYEMTRSENSKELKLTAQQKKYGLTEQGGKNVLPVPFEYKLKLEGNTNDYYFTASNGKRERKVPEEDYLFPGPFLTQ